MRHLAEMLEPLKLTATPDPIYPPPHREIRRSGEPRRKCHARRAAEREQRRAEVHEASDPENLTAVHVAQHLHVRLLDTSSVRRLLGPEGPTRVPPAERPNARRLQAGTIATVPCSHAGERSLMRASNCC